METKELNKKIEKICDIDKVLIVLVVNDQYPNPSCEVGSDCSQEYVKLFNEKEFINKKLEQGYHLISVSTYFHYFRYCPITFNRLFFKRKYKITKYYFRDNFLERIKK